jgi:serpin B
MKYLFTLIILALTMTTALAPSTAGSDDTAKLVVGNNQFAFEMYGQLVADEEGNLIFSPYSISQAFAMLTAGAAGNTEEQLLSAFHFPPDTYHADIAALNENLANRPAPNEDEGDRLELNIANSLWAQEGFPFRQDYFDLLEAYYNGGLRYVDYMSAPDDSRETINTWVEDQTNDKIQDLLPEGSISPATRLVLVNAIYFNATWLNPFIKAATQDGTFNLLDGSTVSVPMMFQQEGLLVALNEEYSAVSLPYVGGDMAMLVIMPADFASFEADLNPEVFTTIRDSLRSAIVDLTMPKFSYEFGVSLSDATKALGVTDAFDPGMADLTRMFDREAAGGQNLFVSDALHKAFIAVDEIGTEAAAATAIIVDATSAPAEVLSLTLDRPFIYAIYDQQTGSVLFLGRVLNPAE